MTAKNINRTNTKNSFTKRTGSTRSTATTPHQRATSAAAGRNDLLEKIVSVRELCNGNDDLIKHLQLDDASYVVPTFNWKKTKYADTRTKKLDYIKTFTDKGAINEYTQLRKVFEQKKITQPGPNHYELTKDWGKKSPYDFENQKGKIFRYDSMTNTANIMRLAKIAKFPAPTDYTPKRQNKNPIIGPMHYSSVQMSMVPNMVWKGKQTPGFCYNITKVVSASFFLTNNSSCIRLKQSHEALL